MWGSGMAELRVSNWNVEWMNRWFTNDGTRAAWKADGDIAGVSDIAGLAARVAGVIDAMAPDILTLQEGPSRREELALFVDDHLGGRFDIIGPAGKGQQKLYALVRKASPLIAEVTPVLLRDGFDFAAPFDVDVDGDLVLAPYQMTRPPLVFDVTLAGGRVIEVVSLHLKSKYVHGGEQLWTDPDRRQDFIAAAMLARRRISAEAMRVRAYLNHRLEADEGAAILVTGDLNDGPGLDYFETRYLTHNLVDLVAGSSYVPRRMLRHAFVDLVLKEENFTAIFQDFILGEETRPLLDHILCSPGLYWDQAGARAVFGRVDHDHWQAGVDGSLPGERERMPSDHRPQSATIRLAPEA